MLSIAHECLLGGTTKNLGNAVDSEVMFADSVVMRLEIISISIEIAERQKKGRGIRTAEASKSLLTPPVGVKFRAKLTMTQKNTILL